MCDMCNREEPLDVQLKTWEWYKENYLRELKRIEGMIEYLKQKIASHGSLV